MEEEREGIEMRGAGIGWGALDESTAIHIVTSVSDPPLRGRICSNDITSDIRIIRPSERGLHVVGRILRATADC